METNAMKQGTPSLQQDAGDFDPTSLSEDRSSRIASLVGLVLTLATIAMIIVTARELSLQAIMAMLPTRPLFWIAFALLYMLIPLSEWVIFHRLWGIPASGIVALTRKNVANEIVLGYLGEAKFYTWARQNVRLETAPFGAIKDVTILSALTGNIATLVMLVFAWPLVASGAIGVEMRTVFYSLGVVLVTSFVMLLLRRRLFSLPRKELAFITTTHFLRIVGLIALSALMWHWVLPSVAVSLWLVLATLRMLVSRLPLVPNKDVVFAGLVVYLLGKETQVADMLTMMAGLVLLAHLAVGATFALTGLIGEARRA